MPPLLRGLLLTSLLASGSGDSPDESRLLADFPESTQDLPWRVVDDSVMGGRSEGSLRLEDRWLVFSGRTNTDGGGFSSIRSDTRRFDLGAFEGIRLRVRGDGRRYTFRLTTWDTRGERRRPSYWADFETGGNGWEVIDVPFRHFRPRWRGRWLDGPELDAGAVDSLGLMIYDGRDGTFHLEVDWIRAYRAREAL
jgi:NADH dehydrogenase [ubiquinone] 1 alpha subcomplex assembly factor 1